MRPAERTERSGWWWCLAGAGALLVGCGNSEMRARFMVDDRPPGHFAPSSRELTAQRTIGTALYVAAEIAFGGCDDD